MSSVGDAHGDDRPGSPNRFTRLVGCRVPLQLAAMGGVSTAPLAGAVAAAGGLGMLAAALVGADELARRIDEARMIGGPAGRVGVGFLMPFLDREAFETAATRAAVVECFYGPPDAELVAAVHSGGARAAWQVGSLDEARAALDADCDLVVVQGVEAGGHVHGSRALDELLADVRAETDRPLVAAAALYAGRSVDAVTGPATAAEIVAEFASILSRV